MREDELLAKVCETNVRYLALGNERWTEHGALFIRNRETPRRHDANCVALVRTNDHSEIDALFRSADVAFEGNTHRMFGIDPLTPLAFVARIGIEDGYRHSEGLVSVLQGALRARPRPEIEIREVLTEEDWSAYMEMDAMWWRESGEGDDAFGPYDLDLHYEMLASGRAKSPQVRRWFALVDGVPRAFFGSWPGENGVGIVEDLFCDPDYRNRGLATALLAHCVADARERGAGPVIINSAINDTPKHLYDRVGFKPLYITRSYLKKVDPSTAAAQ